MSVKLPKQKTLDSWKAKSKWLTIENGHMFCASCTKYEQRISSTKGFSGNRTRLQKGVKSTTKQGREEKPTDLIYQRMHRLRKVFKHMRQTESEGQQKLFDRYKRQTAK